MNQDNQATFPRLPTLPVFEMILLYLFLFPQISSTPLPSFSADDLVSHLSEKVGAIKGELSSPYHTDLLTSICIQLLSLESVLTFEISLQCALAPVPCHLPKEVRVSHLSCKTNFFLLIFS